MSDSKKKVVIELDAENVDFEYLKEAGFDRKITPLEGFVKVWKGTLSESEIEDLEGKDWVREIGEPEGIHINS